MSLTGKRKPVRQTILSFFGVFVLIMTLLSAGFISVVVYKIEEAIWLERRQDAADNAAGTVVDFLERVKSLMIFSVRDLDYETEHDRVELGLLLDSAPAFIEIIEVSSDGEILVAVSKDEKVLANSFAVRQSYWFSRAKQGAVFVGPVEYAANGGPYLIMAVSSAGGDVLAARIGMSVLNDVVRDIRLGSSGQIFVVDESGYLLAHPDPILMKGYTNISSHSSLSQMLSSGEEIWRGRYRSLQGAEVLGTARRIADTGWTVLAEVNVAEAFFNSRITWLILLVLQLLLGSAAMLTAVRLLDRWIFFPLHALRNGAEEIQFGDLSVQVPIFRVDEIGDVAHSFNRMAESLKSHEQTLLEQAEALRSEVARRVVTQEELVRLNQELEIRVQVRTEELSTANLRLRESESKFHNLVENIPAVTYQADLKEDGPKVLYVSPQIGELLGFTPAEWLEEGRWVGQIHPDDFAVLDPFYTQMRATADHYSLEYRLFSRSGKTVWVKDQGIVRDRGGIFRYIQGVMSDITLERENKDVLVKQALHDGLTDLPNRSLLIERLGHVMRRAERHPEITYALLFLDLDGFKSVNDQFGHASGDQVLIETAARIQSCVREFDTVARFGGDEFVVLVEDPKDVAALRMIVDRIQAEIRRPFDIHGHEVRLSASIGMVCCEEKFLDPLEMIHAADVMMYRVKMEFKAQQRLMEQSES